MERNLYLMMNKPVGYVCSAVSDSHKTVYELLTPELQELVQGAKRGHRLHTIGRLDCDTSGLLLLTNDGDFSHKVSASQKINGLGLSKTYRAVLAVPVSDDDRAAYSAAAKKGILLPPEKKFGEQLAESAEIKWITSTNCKHTEAGKQLVKVVDDDVQLADRVCEITVYEGKFHEVRRIFKALGNEVVMLERISIGSLRLPEDLACGCYREMTEEEKRLIDYRVKPDNDNVY